MTNPTVAPDPLCKRLARWLRGHVTDAAYVEQPTIAR